MSVFMQKSIIVFLSSSIAINDGQLGASRYTLGTKDFIFFATAIYHYCAGVEG